MQAIFMVGEQRSGSNLLRLILNESSSIAAPHPPHILQRFMPLLPVYGDLNNQGAFKKLIEDVCRLVELNPVPWDKVKLDRKEILNRCQEKSLIAVYGAVMDLYAEAHNATAWMCKSMQNIQWAEDINRYFNNPKYIYLYRDPRDVTLSFTKAVIGEKHPYFIARQWNELQNLCIAQLNEHKETIFPLSYENLLADPENMVKDLCQFLDIEFSKNMLDFHTSKEAERSAKSSSLWENLSQPIKSNNSKKFLNEFTTDEIRIIESITGEVMDTLGYERAVVQKGEELTFTDEEIEQFAQENATAKASNSAKVDPEDLKRRNLQTGFLNKIAEKIPA
ncbi:MAG: sulfotransferase [Gammaproteobacteria bacterium]|nr:sulfotransferase [Gammaproteobacteria bacterium]MCW8987923.1 sulfotransferase [Gammaproteobacteria bacterium]